MTTEVYITTLTGDGRMEKKGVKEFEKDSSRFFRFRISGRLIKIPAFGQLHLTSLEKIKVRVWTGMG
jgi:hypothetical protein